MVLRQRGGILMDVSGLEKGHLQICFLMHYNGCIGKSLLIKTLKLSLHRLSRVNDVLVSCKELCSCRFRDVM